MVEVFRIYYWKITHLFSLPPFHQIRHRDGHSAYSRPSSAQVCGFG
jgi:hypothetical protein